MSDLEDMSYETEGTTGGNKKGFNWKLLSIVTSIMAFILLFGIWYANNEKAFLAIENKKLKVEIENLKEEIEVLHAEIAQNDNQAQETSEENQVQDETSSENSDETSLTESGTNDTSTETQSEYKNYVVKPGDTLSGISISLYGTENYASQIAELNGLTLESILQVGQTLKVPNKPAE